uniref:Uncharacterized protein LOC102805510 n=1 Tax=Saccoglossus kowalevskii TaxID=10224 RepID=A0ABM0M849_SACKO|nr:PREDICTED: uncharacterized protein LOC102805510 [Saccoglossus kowalevskii]
MLRLLMVLIAVSVIAAAPMKRCVCLEDIPGYWLLGEGDMPAEEHTDGGSSFHTSGSSFHTNLGTLDVSDRLSQGLKIESSDSDIVIDPIFSALNTASNLYQVLHGMMEAEEDAAIRQALADMLARVSNSTSPVTEDEINRQIRIYQDYISFLQVYSMAQSHLSFVLERKQDLEDYNTNDDPAIEDELARIESEIEQYRQAVTRLKKQSSTLFHRRSEHDNSYVSFLTINIKWKSHILYI